MMAWQKTFVLLVVQGGMLGSAWPLINSVNSSKPVQAVQGHGMHAVARRDAHEDVDACFGQSLVSMLFTIYISYVVIHAIRTHSIDQKRMEMHGYSM